jgi:CubicO group peptidase (beta-lactamase class C family)
MQLRLNRREVLAAGATLACGHMYPGVSRAARAAKISADQVSTIRTAALDAINSGDIPGVVSVIWRKGEVVYADEAGLRDIDHKLPMERSTIFGIASMSKPVTVVLALTLVEQGKIRLEDPITRWAPEFANMRVLRRADGPLEETYPAPRAISIEDLMTHRSGLSYGFMAQGPLGATLSAKFGMGIESDLSPDAWMQSLAALPLAYAPGERFNYGHSIDVLGFIVARAAGSNLRDTMHERVLGPLKMADTDFWIPPKKRGRAAQGYFSPAPHQFVSVNIAGFVGETPPTYTSGGQGLVSTIDDYLAFAHMLVRGGKVDSVRLLKTETVKLMTTNRLTDAQRKVPFMGIPFWRNQGFGLGVSLVTDPEKDEQSGSRGAFGWPGAFGGWWRADPEQDMILLWLQECLPAPPARGASGLPRIPGLRGRMEFQRQTYAVSG